MSNLNVDQFLADLARTIRKCGNSLFKDSYFGHIATGDLRIIRDNKTFYLRSKESRTKENRFLPSKGKDH